jgi:AcrR family transcriptional regulator
MRKGEQTRQAILDQAVQLASQVGLGGLTIGGLAGALRLSKSGLFAHFKSKEALDAQVLERVAQRFVEDVVRPALRAPRGEPRLRALFERWMAWGRRPDLPGGCPLVAAIVELDDRPCEARDVLVTQQRDWLDTIAQVVRSGIGEGQFRADLVPEDAAWELYGIFFARHMSGRLLVDPEADARARRAFDAFVARARAR